MTRVSNQRYYVDLDTVTHLAAADPGERAERPVKVGAHAIAHREELDPEFSAWLHRYGITYEVLRDPGVNGWPEIRYTGRLVALAEMMSLWFDGVDGATTRALVPINIPPRGRQVVGLSFFIENKTPAEAERLVRVFLDRHKAELAAMGLDHDEPEHLDHMDGVVEDT